MVEHQSKPNADDLIASVDYRRNAILVTLTTTVVLFVIMILAYITTPADNPTAGYISVVVIGVMTLTALVSAYLSFRGRETLGVEILLVIFYMGNLPLPALIRGLTPAMVMGVLLIPSAISTYTLPNRFNRRVIIGSIVTAICMIAIDVLWPSYRSTVPNPVVFNIVFTVEFIVYGVFIARRFPTFGLRAKLLIVVVGLSLASVVVLSTYNSNIAQRQLTEYIGSKIKQVTDSQSRAVAEELNRQIDRLSALGLSDVLEEAVSGHNSTYTGTQDDIQGIIQQIDLIWRAADAANNDNDLLVFEKLNNDPSFELRAYRERFPDNREVIGILRSTYLVSALENLLSAELLGLGTNSNLDLVFPGELVQHIHEGGLLEVPGDLYATLQQAKNEDYVQGSYEGVLSIYSVSLVQDIQRSPAIIDLGWYIAAYQPVEDALAPIQAQSRTVFLFSMVIAVVASALPIRAQIKVESEI